MNIRVTLFSFCDIGPCLQFGKLSPGFFPVDGFLLKESHSLRIAVPPHAISASSRILESITSGTSDPDRERLRICLVEKVIFTGCEKRNKNKLLELDLFISSEDGFTEVEFYCRWIAASSLVPKIWKGDEAFYRDGIAKR